MLSKNGCDFCLLDHKVAESHFLASMTQIQLHYLPIYIFNRFLKKMLVIINDLHDDKLNWKQNQ